jgi:hypothetical protein
MQGSKQTDSSRAILHNATIKQKRNAKRKPKQPNQASDKKHSNLLSPLIPPQRSPSPQIKLSRYINPYMQTITPFCKLTFPPKLTESPSACRTATCCLPAGSLKMMQVPPPLTMFPRLASRGLPRAANLARMLTRWPLRGRLACTAVSSVSNARRTRTEGV